MRSALLVLAHASWYVVAAWQCDSIKIGSERFDLSALDGEYSLDDSEKTPLIVRHNVYTINPCAYLKRPKDVPSEEQCPVHTLVCKVSSIEKDSQRTVTEVVPYAMSAHESEEPMAKIIPTDDMEPDGVQVVYFGGKMTDGTQASTKIDFMCDKDVDVGKPVLQASKDNKVATFEWRTKHACSRSKDDGPKDDGPRKRPGDDSSDRPRHKSSSWGFFTWIFLIAFMAIASFLIFTLFLNYNRYGQVGLDLVPAMDSVKDIPYLFKDFASQVVETVKGSGSGRSGYSAV